MSENGRAQAKPREDVPAGNMGEGSVVLKT